MSKTTKLLATDWLVLKTIMGGVVIDPDADNEEEFSRSGGCECCSRYFGGDDFEYAKAIRNLYFEKFLIKLTIIDRTKTGLPEKVTVVDTYPHMKPDDHHSRVGDTWAYIKDITLEGQVIPYNNYLCFYDLGVVAGEATMVVTNRQEK